MLVTATLNNPITEMKDELGGSIIRSLLYFKIFNYPVKKEELFQFVSSDNKIAVQASLAKLIGKGWVQCKEDFVWIENDEKIVAERIAGNQKAKKYLRIAQRQAWWLSKFPFIKCICISGSLSKRCMDDHADIDYFIIAKKNRLWLTKLLMSTIVETLEVFGLEKYFCPNYLITENNLNITDRNIYTAIEIATLIPLYNQAEYERFLQVNDWIREYFPHYTQNLPERTFAYKKKLLKSFWEHNVFNWMNEKLFRFYKRRFMMKVRKGKIIAFDNDMVLTEDDFKLHLSGHRKRILQRYAENIQRFEESHNVIL